MEELKEYIQLMIEAEQNRKYVTVVESISIRGYIRALKNVLKLIEIIEGEKKWVR